MFSFPARVVGIRFYVGERGEEVPIYKIFLCDPLQVDDSSARKALAKAEGVNWQRRREKPQRTPEQPAGRKESCEKALPSEELLRRHCRHDNGLQTF